MESVFSVTKHAELNPARGAHELLPGQPSHVQSACRAFVLGGAKPGAILASIGANQPQGAARKAELDALRYSNVATLADNDADTDQSTLPFPLG